MSVGEIDILGTTESWTHEGISDAEISFKGYTLFRKDRERVDNRRGGGCLLYIRDSIKASRIMNEEGSESIWARVKLSKTENISIGVCYRNPNISKDEKKKLFKAIKTASIINCLIMGYFNFEDIDWISGMTDGNGEEFLDLINDCFLIQNVYTHTRGQSILDLIFSSEKGMVDNLQVGCPLANSDHNTITWTLQVRKQRDVEGNKIYNYNKANYSTICEELMK